MGILVPNDITEWSIGAVLVYLGVMCLTFGLIPLSLLWEFGIDWSSVHMVIFGIGMVGVGVIVHTKEEGIGRNVVSPLELKKKWC